MILSELLPTLNQDELVYISSKSAFVFIGLPKDFQKELKQLNKHWLGRYKKVARQSLGRYESAKGMGTTKPAMLYQLKVAADRSKVVLDGFIDFDKREVIEYYRNIANTGTIVMITGDECGKFWLPTEWDRYKQGHKNFTEEDDEDGGKDMADVENANEICWEKGIYNSECDCSICDHRHECSGSDAEDDDE